MGIFSPSLSSGEKKDFLSSSLPSGPGRACSHSPGSSQSQSVRLASAPPKSICCPCAAGTRHGSTFSPTACVSPGRSGAGGGCTGQRHRHHRGSSLFCGAGGISRNSPGCTLGVQTGSSVPVFIFLACFQLLSSSPPHAVSEA